MAVENNDSEAGFISNSERGLDTVAADLSCCTEMACSCWVYPFYTGDTEVAVLGVPIDGIPPRSRPMATSR